ncbi:MAG: hypothetical protein CMI55_00505 [Parcubacteria group bacterium]|jgi:hypothetical protein|nr:hypothetical protein [Parcubacteria group bacterium]|tara:strand:- start:4430 stop:5002 length:573 start_codon:yes stop_codon:yes gene_type:complete
MKLTKREFLFAIGAGAAAACSPSGAGNDDECEFNYDYYDVVPRASDDGIITLKIKVWCLSHTNGGTIPPEEGTIIYLHSMTLNHADPCNDVIAWAPIRNGWLTFNFLNPADSPANDGFRDRFWGSVLRECDFNTPTWWLCIPKERNPYYREECPPSRNPAIEMVFWRLNQKITVVPSWEPCDQVGPGCQP